MEEHCTITIALRRFRSCDGEDSVSEEYECDNDSFREYFTVTSYANGSCPENEGHVSIIFNGVRPIHGFFRRSVAFSCTASVVDASGGSRFQQSMALSSGGDLVSVFESFGFERYLRRSALLDHADELLPDDCLTLRLEIDFEITDRGTPTMFPRIGLHEENDGCYLDTSTDFFRELCGLSPVFRAMVDSPFKERETGLFRFPPDEERDFFLIYTFLTGSNLQVSLPDICKLYRFADKYDMRQIVELCHQLLLSLMRAMNTQVHWIKFQKMLDYVSQYVHVLLELADAFEGDEVLKQILEIYSDIQAKLEDGTLVLGTFNPIRLETEWTCDKEGNEFVFRRVKSEPSPNDSLK